jgi:type VI secretion system protein ImpK
MRLRDSFAELLAYVAYFLKSDIQNSLSYSQVQTDVQRLLSESDAMGRQGQIASEEFDEARFAICAWIDESILNSAWQGRSQWQKELLQRRYYQTTDAGEEFFERLNRLDQQQRGAREIYYLCLAMGFKGRYHQQGDDLLLDQLKTSNLKYLLGSSVGLPALDRTELFPEAYPVESAGPAAAARQSIFTPVAIAVFISPVLLFGVLFFIYTFILNNIGENFLKAVS